MKKHRSSQFTKGVCNTVHDSDLRFPFFEIDPYYNDKLNFITSHYLTNKLDFLIHKTGSGGYHFLSPTMMPKDEWKEFMKPLKEINRKCPMTTLRVMPNKYPNESSIWYRNDYFYHDTNYLYNNHSMCLYLNKIWHTNFQGKLDYDIKIVTYPLPYVPYVRQNV